MDTRLYYGEDATCVLSWKSLKQEIDGDGT